MQALVKLGVPILAGMTGADAFACAGGLLQIVGVLEVAVEISRARRRFHRAPLALASAGWVWERARRALRRPGRANAKPLEGSLGFGGSLAAEGKVVVSGSARLGQPTFDERLRELHVDMQHQSKRLDDLDREATGVADALSALQRDLRSAIGRLDDAVTDVATGGLRLRGFGVAFIIAGVAFVTWTTWWADHVWAAPVTLAGMVIATL